MATANRAQTIFKPEFRLGLGGVPLGNEFNKITDEQADADARGRVGGGVRYFDTAPWYGFGLSERRFGHFMHNQRREDYVLSSKVGKLFKASKHNRHREIFPFSDSPNDVTYDYAGRRRAPLDRRQPAAARRRQPRHRVRARHLAGLFYFPTSWEEAVRDRAQGRSSPFRGCARRDHSGVGHRRELPRAHHFAFSKCADPDVCLCASQYSLVDHANAVKQVFPACAREERFARDRLGAERRVPLWQLALQLRTQESRDPRRVPRAARADPRGRRPPRRRSAYRSPCNSRLRLMSPSLWSSARAMPGKSTKTTTRCRRRFPRPSGRR